MLTVIVPDGEYFDEKTEEFVNLPGHKLHLEHSLVSLSKWESFWEKPFLNNQDRTDEETLSYIEMMSLDEPFPREVLPRLTKAHIQQITTYINRKMTATTFNESPNKAPSREIITSEILYYWMIKFGIPFECQHWHLERLLTLIKVVSHKESPQKKMSRAEVAARNRALNEQRLKQLGTTG